MGNINRFFYFTMVLFLILVIIFLLNKLRQKTTQELEKILYFQNKPNLFLKLLKNPRLKILYRKSTLLQFELNAYLLIGNDNKIQHLFDLMDSMVMSKGESLEYNQKKLSYYSSLGRKDKAEEALKNIEVILFKVKGDKTQTILKESKLIFDIYIKHDTKLINVLKEAEAVQQGPVRGLTQYRLAKLYYFDKNEKQAKLYLLEAQKLLMNTAWYYIIEEALKDMTILTNK